MIRQNNAARDQVKGKENLHGIIVVPWPTSALASIHTLIQNVPFNRSPRVTMAFMEHEQCVVSTLDRFQHGEWWVRFIFIVFTKSRRPHLTELNALIIAY